MQISLHPDVEKKILKARIALSLRQPFLASAIMRLPIKDATVYSWCQTMATDGYHIFFNSNWVSNLSQSELRGVLAHEVLHVIFQHSSRRLNRDPIVWNIAADHAINLLLIEQQPHLTMLQCCNLIFVLGIGRHNRIYSIPYTVYGIPYMMVYHI